MKINTESIDGYADMTAEEKIAALEAFEFDDNSSKVTELEERNTKNKKALDEALKKLGDMNKERREKMTEDEKAKADFEAQASELAELKQSIARRDGVDAILDAYKEYGMTREQAEKHYDTKDTKIIKDLMDAYAKKLKEDLANKQPDPNAGHNKGKENDFVKPTRTVSKQLNMAELNKYFK